MDQDYLACPLGVLFLLSSIVGSRAVGGQTGVELVRALRLRSPIADNSLQLAMYESKLLHRELVDDLVAEQSVVNRKRLGIITVSNGMFLRDDYRMRSDFLRSIQNDFQVTVQQNTRFSFIVVLPTERWERTWIDRMLTGQYNIRDLVAAQQPEVVSLKMPKFRMQQTSDLTSALKSMGVISVFQKGEADFSGMTDTNNVHIGMVKQGAVMSVNEIGVDPAGVTASISGASTRLEPTVEFIVDQPFVCMIYDEQLKLPVFTARVDRFYNTAEYGENISGNQKTNLAKRRSLSTVAGGVGS
ncbi:serine proteinase inhibitor, partial [Opisthorchis viverrini]